MEKRKRGLVDRFSFHLLHFPLWVEVVARARLARHSRHAERGWETEGRRAVEDGALRRASARANVGPNGINN